MGLGNRSSSERRASVPPGWVPRPLGAGSRCSSEHRAPPPGTRQSALLGAPSGRFLQGSPLFGARRSRGQATGALRSPARRASLEPGQRSSSERRQPVPPGQRHRPSSEERQPSPGGAGSPSLTGVRQTALFGGPRAEPHRGQADGTLRRAARRASPGHGNRSSSGPRALLPVETGITRLIGKPVPPTPRGERRSATRGTG
jgi:hypothetical protein